VRRYTAVEKYSSKSIPRCPPSRCPRKVFQDVPQSKSIPDVPQQKCNFLPGVSMQSKESRINWHSRDPGCGMLLQLPHDALSNTSNYLVVDHVAHSKFHDASSNSPKQKLAHRHVRRTRGPRRITPFTYQSARKLPPKISNCCVTGCQN
jgi:hypothetical protein